MKYYVYELIDPRDGNVFYVGKGKNNRMYRHYNSVKNNKIPNNNKHLYNKIKQLIDNNLIPICNKIYESDDENSCYIKEIEHILEIGIDNLCNLTYGGKGTISIQEVKDKISLHHVDVSGKNNPMFGKHHSEEIKNEISNITKNRYENKENHPWYGKHLSEEHKQKLSKIKIKPLFEYDIICLTCKTSYKVRLTEYKYNMKKYSPYCCKECRPKNIYTDEERLKMSCQMKERKEYILYCKKCGLEYKLTLISSNFDKGKYTKFCSRSCANTRTHTEKTKQLLKNKRSEFCSNTDNIEKLKNSLRDSYKNMTETERKNHFGHNKGKSPWNEGKTYSVKSKADRIYDLYNTEICELYKSGRSFSHIAKYITNTKGIKISYQIVKCILKMNVLYNGNTNKRI